MIDRNKVNIGVTVNQLPYIIPTQAAPFAVGTAMLFQQTAAPAGWVKVFTNDNTALRVVSGATGGSFTAGPAFSTVLTTQTNNGSGTLSATTLSTTQLPIHSHLVGVSRNAIVPTCGGFFYFSAVTTYLQPGSTNPAIISGPNIPVGGSSHTHAISGALSTSINLSVYYVDIIIATKS